MRNIIRIADAQDNELNLEMRKILNRYTEKKGLEIEKEEIYKCAVAFYIVGGGELRCNVTDSAYACNSKPSNYIYLKSIVNGKSKRVPKSEW